MIPLIVAASLAQVVSPQGPALPRPEPRLEPAALPGIGEVWLDVRPFAALDRGFRAEVVAPGAANGAAARPDEAAGAAAHGVEVAALAASVESAACAVVTRSGGVVGFPGSFAYLAESPRGRLGIVDVAGRRFALAPVEGHWAGPIKGPAQWIESPGAGAPLIDEACRVHDAGRAAGHGYDGDGHAPGAGHDDAEGGVAGPVVPGDPIALVRGMRVLVAADADYEFTSIFADPEDCAAYVASLYGAISALYEREMSLRVQLSYLRLWTDPRDPYDASSPLEDFRDLWNETQGDVVRDVAQLLSGRRNLPYGGVAWLSAACGGFGYSVAGYLIGSFADPGRSDPGNWDIIVAAHELGHNIGTLHTHDYGIDACAFGEILRGGIMSYCHTVSGATANVDLTLHAIVRSEIAWFMVNAPCLGRDCDGDGVEDSTAIAEGIVADRNRDGIPDGCQDCDGDGVLDPEAIAAGAADLDGDGVPDACQPDCNGNGVVDTIDVLSGASADLWGNMIPDECEVDCNGNGVADFNEIQLDMSLDIDRDGRLDACQDCDGDGVLDAEVLGSSRLWWVASSGDGRLRELHPRSGVCIRTSEAAQAPVHGLALSADGDILGASGSAIRRWDPATGVSLGALVPFGGGGLSQARDLLVMPDGSIVVAGHGSAAIHRFGPDGSPLGTLVAFDGSPLPRPTGLALRSDGVIAVSTSDGVVRGFEWPGGAPAGVLADLNVIGPGSDPAGILFLPDGDLLVAARGFSSIERFDGSTGAHEGRFDRGPAPGSAIAMTNPTSLRLIADGKVVLVTDDGNGAPIVGLDAETGYHLRTYRVYPTDAPAATGLLVMPPSPLDCNGNMVPDACDIARGTSADADGDGIPDECREGATIVGDLTGDGAVDGADLAILLGAWGVCQGTPCTADLDADRTIGGADLAILLGAWTG